MFQRIFIIEDTQSDIDELVDFLGVLGIGENQIDIIQNINNAFSEIKDKCKSDKSYLAFIDIVWKNIERGITLAKTIKKNFLNIKLIAYTKLSPEIKIEDIVKVFHGLLDKNTTNPDPIGFSIGELDLDLLERIKDTENFLVYDENLIKSKKKLLKKSRDSVENRIFIGHGRSHVWKDLKNFIQDRLKLSWEEFNRVPIAGIMNTERLQQILEKVTIAFLIMTAEDEQQDGKHHARMNVIHEVGLFQGKLGFHRAIVLIEEGCEKFSNINGLGQIEFPKDNIDRIFEEIRRVLEREKIIDG